MIRLFTLLLLFVSFTQEITAQKALMLEKKGSLKTKKYFAGDLLIFKIKNIPGEWLSEEILDFDLESNYIFLENRSIPIHDITHIRTGSNSLFVRRISGLLGTFSYVWSFWSLVSLAYGETLTPFKWGIALGTFGTAQLLRLAFYNTHKMGEKKRIRLIDLTFYGT